MLKRMVLVACFALVPSVGVAQTVQENYLPPKSQLYFRWDGMATHQAAYDKTAVGKMMKGETGVFLDELWKYTQEQLLNAARNEPKVGPLLKDFTKLAGAMYNNGLVFAIEVDQVLPQPKAQALLIFPKAAGESGTLLPLVQKIAEDTRAEVKNTKVGKRFVHSIEVEFVKFGWWAQGDDAIMYLGTLDPVAYAKDIDAQKTGLTKNPLYQKVAGFKEFTTNTRGYFDLASVISLGSGIRPEVGKIVDELGLNGLKSMTFYSGFDGMAERSVVDVDVVGPRKGLMALGSQKKMTLKDLPIMPNDLKGFSASTLNLSKSYEVIAKIVDGVVNVVAPNEADNVKEAIKAFQGAVGVDINKDLFGCFGDIMVTYSSPTDGFLGTGSLVAVQIKDGKKLEQTLEKLVKAVPVGPGGKFTLKKKTYHGGEIMQLQMSGDMINSHIATFGIYKGWFVYAQLPQPIKGFILRQEGELPAWKADADLTKALAQFPKEFNSISVSDPRPTVQTVLSITPFLINIGNSVGAPLVPGFRPFDLELVPHAQEATRHLFPNVTVGIDDGKRIRAETRGSLLLPF